MNVRGVSMSFATERGYVENSIFNEKVKWDSDYG